MVTTPRSRSAICSHLSLGCNLVLFCLLAANAGPMESVLAAGPEEKKEEPYALIYGTVYGPDNRTVYGVKVRIRRADQKKPHWELYSDHSGEFAQRVPAGQADYIVWADLKGFKSLDKKELHPGPEVAVHIQNDERSDISLHLK